MASKHPKERAIGRREDISRFLVHLTRDDSGTFPRGGASARKNFLSILNAGAVHAYRAHCLHGSRLANLDANVQQRFHVACFTEVPLNQLHLLVRPIPGRDIELASYGFVFTKEFVVSQGAQPAIYVNSYAGNGFLREAADALFEHVAQGASASGKFRGPLWRLLPFLNAMHEHYDFAWEREWRIRRRLAFSSKDLVCVILPKESEDDLKHRFAAGGIAVVSPGWTYEQIVAELARQQRATRKMALNKVSPGGVAGPKSER